MAMEMNTENIVRPETSRRTVATYSRYGEAQRAVDYLSDQHFPVERVAIVAEGLKLVEQVTGRLTYGRVAMSGAAGGAFMGGLFGFMLGLFSWISPVISAFQIALYGIVYGSLVGAALSVVFYSLTGGRRDFSSVGGISADRYNVMVDDEAAGEAMRLLTQMRGTIQEPGGPAGPPVTQPA